MPRSAMVTPNRRLMRAIVIGLWVMTTKRVSVWRDIASSRSQYRSTFASSRGASTSSRTQIGEGFVRKTAKISAVAVSACSPPGQESHALRLLPRWARQNLEAGFEGIVRIDQGQFRGSAPEQGREQVPEMAVDDIEGAQEPLASLPVEAADGLSQALDRLHQVVPFGGKARMLALELGEFLLGAKVHRSEPLPVAPEAGQFRLDVPLRRQLDFLVERRRARSVRPASYPGSRRSPGRSRPCAGRPPPVAPVIRPSPRGRPPCSPGPRGRRGRSPTGRPRPRRAGPPPPRAALPRLPVPTAGSGASSGRCRAPPATPRARSAPGRDARRDRRRPVAARSERSVHWRISAVIASWRRRRICASCTRVWSIALASDAAARRSATRVLASRSRLSRSGAGARSSRTASASCARWRASASLSARRVRPS